MRMASAEVCEPTSASTDPEFRSSAEDDFESALAACEESGPELIHRSRSAVLTAGRGPGSQPLQPQCSSVLNDSSSESGNEPTGTAICQRTQPRDALLRNRGGYSVLCHRPFPSWRPGAIW